MLPQEEDDEELVSKAKANRAQRLAEQRATTREFVSDEGFANRKLEQKLIPVQKGVYKLQVCDCVRLPCVVCCVGRWWDLLH